MLPDSSKPVSDNTRTVHCAVAADFRKLSSETVYYQQRIA